MKMKRFAAALLALILCAAFMTACSPKPEQPAATSGNASSGSAAAEPAATAEPTSAPTPVPPETTAMPEKTDTSVTVTPEKNGLYDALCDLFNNYHEGTAGCSLTGARIAATIIMAKNNMYASRCKRDAMVKALHDCYHESIDVVIPEGGMFLWVHFKLS